MAIGRLVFKRRKMCEKERSDCGRQVRRKDSLIRTQKSATGKTQARQEQQVDLLVSATRRYRFYMTRIATTGILHASFFTNRQILSSAGSHTSATIRKKDSNMMAKGKPGGNSASSSNGEHQRVSLSVSLRREGRALSRDASQSKRFTKTIVARRQESQLSGLGIIEALISQSVKKIGHDTEGATFTRSPSR